MYMMKRFLCLGGIIGFLTGCDLIDHHRFHDPGLKLQREAYEALTKPSPIPFTPPLKRIPCKPCAQVPLLPAEMKKEVSVALHEQVSLKTVLIELGNHVGVSIALGPDSFTQGITYKAHKLPFIEVIKDLCRLTHHRFQIQGKRILIEPDIPYLATYSLQFLSQKRKSDNRMAVSSDIFSPLDDKKQADNGSNSVLSESTLIDFWTELEQNLKMILGSETKGPPLYTLHKQGGLIIVLGTATQHKEICAYLRKLKEATSAQVIIEAKIIEVTLDNAYKTGINWHHIGQGLKIAAPLGSLSPAQLLNDVFTFTVDIGSFASILNLVKKFGTVRTLSNPRLTVMNNQPAMLKVATNEVFFHLEFERFFQAEGKPDVENISSQAMTVPIGLVMIVQPSVNLETEEITMTLRPTISRVHKEVEDPAVSIKSNQLVKSTVPVVQVRELDSVLKIKSGQILVMGGLMEDRSSSTTSGIPGVDSVPLLGDVVRGKDDERKVTELVIFLTAQIVEDTDPVEADKNLYNTYIEDPRPLSF